MRVGVVLPIFTDSPDRALEVAREAEAAGVDGVFCYDHLWPMGQPERPALAPFPILMAVAGETERVRVGTLVARVGLVPDAVLVSQFSALHLLAPGRVVAGLGTGDRLSAVENLAYGIPMAAADARRASLRWCAQQLSTAGITVWIGGGAPATVRVAEEVGVAVNQWGSEPAAVADQAARCEVTWAGPARRSGPAVEGETLGRMAMSLAEAGATWMVVPYPVSLEHLGAAGRSARGSVGGR